MHVHCIEAIGVLHPVGAIRILSGCGITLDVGQRDISRIHEVKGPELRVFKMKVGDADVGDVPEDKGHRAAFLRIAGFRVVPDGTVAIDVWVRGPVG